MYHETAQVVDAFLRGRLIRAEVRLRGSDGYEIVNDRGGADEFTRDASPRPGLRIQSVNGSGTRTKTLRIFPFGVSKGRLSISSWELGVAATNSRMPADANLVLTLKAQERRQARTLMEMEERGLEVAVIRSNTLSQIKSFLADTFGLEKPGDAEEEALREAREGVDKVLDYGKPVELSPQASPIRRL